MKKAVLIIFVLISIALIFVYVKNNSLVPGSVLQKVGNDISSKIAPTPIPFQELTMPYLIGRQYESSLGELDQYSKSSNYTSYLTNYDSDGFKVNGLLTKPNGEMPEGGWPAIIFVHGYIPPTLYKTTEKYIAYVDYLAKSGFVVFKIDLRGNGDSEGSAGGAYYSSDYAIDALNAYNALQTSDFVNPKKIGLWGHSMAGNVLFRSFVAKKDIPAMVIWAGAGYTYSDLLQNGIQDNSYRPPTDDTERAKKRAELREKYGEFDPNSEFWKQVPATNYLDGVGGAIEIHHAVDDSVVSVEYSRNLMKVLDSSDISHQLFEYPTGGHNITGSSFTKAMQRTVEFFKEKLN